MINCLRKTVTAQNLVTCQISLLENKWVCITILIYIYSYILQNCVICLWLRYVWLRMVMYGNVWL